MIAAGTPTRLVAARELREAMRSKGTRILLALSAVAVAALVVIAHLVSGSGPSATHVALVGEPSQSEAAAYQSIGVALGTPIRLGVIADDDAARTAVDEGDADFAVLADDTIVTDEPVDLDGDSTLASVINVVRADLALSAGLEAAGLDPGAIADVRSTPLPAVDSLHPADTDEVDESRIGMAIVINILLFLLLQMYGGWVIQGVTREKASRVVEVLLSAITARQLLFGKIIGIGVVALLHAGVLIVTALVTTRIVGLDVLDGFRLGDAAVGAVWFLLGYALYCCAFAAAGALCDRAEDAQGASLPIMMPMLVGYLVAFSAAAGGDSVLVWILAYFPPTAVLCMPVLSATGAVPVWAMLLSMALTALAAVGVALLASSIYERSILRTGRRVRWREALGR